jgi:hypothetical protein
MSLKGVCAYIFIATCRESPLEEVEMPVILKMK